jgi:hypothetical protein
MIVQALPPTMFGGWTPDKKVFRTTSQADACHCGTDSSLNSLPMQSSDGARRPLLSTYCPFCADRYRLPVVQERDTADAFSLSNLLPAGTITVTVHNGASPCPSASNYRDWDSLTVRGLSTHPVDSLFRELAFLTEHLFLRATCRLGTSGRMIFIRVYLIPHDLPNVHGRLHRRSEIKTVVKKAQRHMHNIVPLIERNYGLWNADEACLNAPQEHFLPSHLVCGI